MVKHGIITKDQNLKKLAEIITSQNDYEGSWGDEVSIKDYYNVLDYQGALKLNDYITELDKFQNVQNNEWYIMPSYEYLDIYAREFQEAKDSKEIYSQSCWNGKETIIYKYEKMIENFIKPHKKDIQEVVAQYLLKEDNYSNNLYQIFKDYISIKEVAKWIYNLCGMDITLNTLYKRILKNGSIY